MRPRRWVRALAAAVLALALTPVLVQAGPASAAPVGVDYTCRSVVYGIDVVEGPQTLSIDFTLPGSVGDESLVTVPLSIDDNPVNFPFVVADAQVSTQISLAVHRSTGELLSTPSGVGGAPAPSDLGPNQPLPLNWASDLPVSTAGVTSGDAIEVRPGTIVLQYTAADPEIDGTTVTCTPDDPEAVIATANVHASDNQCVADPSCSVGQDLDVEIPPNPQGLTLQELDNVTNFGSIQTAPVDQQLSAALDHVQVQDIRGGDVGWSLTAFAADPFQGVGNPAATIPAESLSLTAACNPVTTDMNGNPSGMPPAQSVCTPGSAGALPAVGSGNAITLASSNNSELGTGGTWWVPLNGDLTIPAYQTADSYSMVLTIVLSSN